VRIAAAGRHLGVRFDLVVCRIAAFGLGHRKNSSPI
jgi:hypothetical protein